MSITSRLWRGRQVAGTVAALAALAVGITVIGDADTDATADTTTVASIPPVPANSSVVTVKTGGDRTGTNTVAPLAGVSLALFANAGDANPIAQPWATCTSDADGDCNFIVPATQTGGANRNIQPYVRQTAAPSGWFANPQLRTGPGDGTSSQANTYQFQTPQLQSGNTYASTSNFMISTANNRVASGGVWQSSRTNPSLPASCGLDAAIVLDLSNSVSPFLAQLKSATDTIVDTLVGTPSRVALFSFGTNAPGINGANLPALVPVSTQAGADAVKAQYAPWSTNGGTNWDQGLLKVAEAAPVYDLVLVLTDGNPTFYSSPSQGNGSDNRFREDENAIFSANAVKAKGSRIAAVGVGSGASGLSGLNLASVSGPVAYPATPPDYFQTTNYPEAAAIIRELALGRCDGTLSIVKQVVPAGTTGEDITGATPAPAGWEFDASSTNAAIGGLPATMITTADGTGAVSFPLTFPGGTTDAIVDVEETQQDGFGIVTQGGDNAVCTDRNTMASVPVTNDNSDPAHPGFAVNVPSTQAITCTVYNRPLPVDVKVDKTWVVDGTTYAEGAQPAGLEAELSLTGPPPAGATPQAWGAVRGGYPRSSQATFFETTTIRDGCTLVSARVTEANGSPVDEALPYAATLSELNNEYTVTNTVTCPPPPADVTVDKTWIVDGTTYAEGAQPAGLDADLTLTGPGGAGATPQGWGVTRTGYQQGDDTTVAETTTIGNGCTLDSARVTEANGGPVDEALPYVATLSQAQNTYMVTNVVTCPVVTTTTTSPSTTSTTVPPATTSTTKPAPPIPGLPKTGSSTTGILVVLGMVLLGIGIPAAAWARRRLT